VNHSAYSLIGALRAATLTVRAISIGISVAFFMLILSPTAKAVQEELDRPAPPPPAPVEGQLMEQVTQLAERLRQWHSALTPDSLTPAAEIERGRQALTALRSEFAVLDEKVRDRLDLAAHQVQAQSGQSGDGGQARIARQQKLAAGYSEKSAEFQRLLDELRAASGTPREKQALDTVAEFLDAHPSGRAHRPFDPEELPTTNLGPLPDNTPRTEPALFTTLPTAAPPDPASAAFRSVTHPHRTGEYASGALGRETPQTQDLTTPRDGRVVNKAGKAEQFATDAPAQNTASDDAAATSTKQAGDPTTTGISNDFDDPVFLATSDEVVLTDAIRAKADELENDPVKIYHWVRNNIDWIPTWGAQQDADITLGSQRGNAIDQAGLLIALLRAADIPARYIIGTIEVEAGRFANWAGGFDDIDSAIALASSGGIPVVGLLSGRQTTAVQMEHVWVEAAIDYEPSRGARHIEPDSWVAIDPSFKQYQFLEGLDPIEIAGLDPEQLAEDFVASGTVNEDESWVTGFDPQILEDAQNDMQTALEQFIEDNLADPTVGDVIGGRKAIVQDFPVVPAALPYTVRVAGARFAEVPEGLQQSIILAFGISHSGFPIDPITIPWAQVNNHKLTVSFTAATQADEQALADLIPADAASIDDLPTTLSGAIQVIPELKLDGQTIHTGSRRLDLGEDMRLFNSVFFPGRGFATRPLSIIAGSYMAIGSESGSISSANLEQLRQKVEQTKSTLETEDPELIATLDREDILGDLFHAGMLGYYAQYTALGSLMGLQTDGQMMLQAGMGTFGYEPRVNRLFGFPVSISPGGVALDIPIARALITDGLDPEANAQFSQQIGLLSSALEHATREQMFSTEDQPADAISAVKALSKANAQGQRIYEMTHDNMAETLPNLNLAFETENEIRRALSAGLTVVAHTNNVSVPGWTGAGYIIFNPDTGDGAYKISGGANGAFLLFVGALLIFLGMFFLPLAPIIASALLSVGLHAFVIGFIELVPMATLSAFLTGIGLVSALLAAAAFFIPAVTITFGGKALLAILGVGLALIDFFEEIGS